MSDIFINQQGLKPPTPIEIEGCHGHQVSIAAGGKYTNLKFIKIKYYEKNI